MADWDEDDDAFLSGQQPATGFRGQPRRGMWRRFLDDVEDAAEYGFIGWTGRRISDALDTDRYGKKMRPGMTEEQRDNELALQTRFKRARMAARDRDDPTFLDKDDAPVDARIGRAAQGLVGNILGGFSPTYALAPGSGPVSRSLGQGAVNAGEDLALQAADIYEGNEDDFDFLRAGVSGVAGTVLQGGQEVAAALRAPRTSLEEAKGIAKEFGTVTSTIRTPKHNKKVGGAKNSHHLRGNAIDIARGKGVSHKQLERAYRRAGYDIIESLDEGDHSHFAFKFGAKPKKGQPVIEDFDFRPPEMRGIDELRRLAELGRQGSERAAELASRQDLEPDFKLPTIEDLDARINERLNQRQIDDIIKQAEDMPILDSSHEKFTPYVERPSDPANDILGPEDLEQKPFIYDERLGDWRDETELERFKRHQEEEEFQKNSKMDGPVYIDNVPEEHLTPAERQEMDASAVRPDISPITPAGLGKGSVATTPVNDLRGDLPKLEDSLRYEDDVFIPVDQKALDTLVPAVIDTDGNVYKGKPGQIHMDVVRDMMEKGVPESKWSHSGFVDKDGNFLTKNQSLEKYGIGDASYQIHLQNERIADVAPPPNPPLPNDPDFPAPGTPGNRGGPKGGGDTPDQKWAGSVNLDRMDISKAAKEHLRTLARGVGTDTRTHEQTKAEAQALLDQYGVDDLIRRTDMPQSEVPAYNTAIRAVDAAAARKVVNLSKTALDPEKSTPAVLAQLDEARLLSAAAYERANEVSGLAGRILDAQKIIVGRGNLNRDVNKLIQTMAGNNVDTLDFARLIAAHEEQAGKIASDSLRPNAEEMLASLWYNWRLSGITTQVANTVGTASHLVLDMITRLADSAIPGQNRTTLGELGERLFGLYVGAKQAVTKLEGEVQLVGHKEKKTVTPVGFAFNQGTPLDLRGKIDTGRAFKSKAGGLLEIPTRSMAAVDEFFRNIAVTSELYGAAFRQARSEGLEGDAFKARLEELVANPSREMEDSAIEYGRRMRFADEASRPTRAMEGLRHAAKNDDYIQRAGAFVLRMMVPFVHTLDRLTAAAFGHSPLGVVNRVNRQGLRKGGHDRRLAASRMAVGTLIALGAALKAANGEITGAGPTDYRRREQLESSGWQPYSIRIGDTYYSIRTLQPISTILGTVATMVEQEKLEGKDKGTLDKIARLAKSAGKAAMSGAWTESLATVLATTDEKSNSKLANWIASVADPSPTILRQINQGYVDTKVRDTTGDGSLGDRVTGRMKASVPGLSDDLPQKHDTYGRPIENQGSLGPDIVSPLKQKKVDRDAIVQEIERLTGDSKTALVNPPKKDDMTAAEYQQYRKIAGDNFMMAMEEHFIGEDWDFLDDEEKRQLVKLELERARTAAREELSDGWDF